MDTYGIIGWPVEHSLSPAMQEAAFKEAGIEAKYVKLPLKPEDLKAFFHGTKVIKDSDGDDIYIADLKGLNVTVPHKEKVLEFIAPHEEFSYVKDIKAANTLILKGNIWQAINTDVLGFKSHLNKLRFEPKDKKIAVLGAGGGSRAVTYALAKQGAAEIDIFDIDKKKALGVAEMLKGLFTDLQVKVVDSVDKLGIPSKDALINATPIGLKESDPCLVSEEMLGNNKNLFVYDLIYNPSETKLLSLAKAAGLRCSNGLGMLLYQGAEAWKYWTGEKEAPVGVMKKALEEALR